MVTLTGTFTRLDGSPASGTVRVTPSRSPIMDPDGKIVISGPQTFPLDQDGKLTTEIPASNDPDLGPAFTYSIDVNLTHASWKISKVWIPHGSTTVDLSEIGDYTPVPGVATRVVTIPADGADGQVLVWDGAGFSWDFPPTGPQGDQGDPGTSDIVVDKSVGTRVFANGIMVHGDTGWRDMSSQLANGWTASMIGIRRIRDSVRIRFYNLSGADATAETFLKLPQGYYEVLGKQTSIPDGATTATITCHINGELTLPLRPERYSSSRLSDVELFIVNTSWPTTLSGTP